MQTEKLASLGQLTAGIAHEIKNPLNFVNNFSALSAELTDELNDVLKPATLADKIREEVDELTGLLKDNLEKVVQHGKRANSIVKNMLLHSREGSGDHRPADINALVDESLNLAYHGARAEKPQFNVTLQRDFDPNAGMIEVFPQEITRVFLNLISNGFYAVTKRKAENGGRVLSRCVSATTQRPRRHRRNPHSRQRHRHPARGEGKDVQSVLHDQAGRRRNRARAVDEPRHHRETTRWHDRGRDRARAVHRIQDRIAANEQFFKQDQRSDVSVLVLVVDDEPDVEALFRQQFRRDLRAQRFVMDFAISAADALARIAGTIEQSLILILSDINMPGMTGLEMLPKVRELRPDVPVIMITAYGDPETKRKAIEGGAEGLLTKPIDFSLLRRGNRHTAGAGKLNFEITA